MGVTEEELRKKGFFDFVYKEKGVPISDRTIDFSSIKKEEEIKEVVVDKIEETPKETFKKTNQEKNPFSVRKMLTEFKEIKQAEYVEFLELKINGLEQKIKSQDQLQKEWLEKAALIRENQELKQKINGLENGG